jgi:hypothetical protein
VKGRAYCNSKVITTSQLSDLANTSKRSTHDNSLITELLIVVEDGLNGTDSWVLLLAVLLLGAGLVPIEDTADKRRDEEGAGLGSGNGLNEREHERQIAVDAVLGLQDLGRLDAFPG